MKKINLIRKALTDNSGLSLIELIISAALLTIIGAGFCTASAGAHIATVKNDKEVKSRTAIVSYIDQNALKPITSDYAGHTTAYLNDFMDASQHGGHKIDYTNWADVQLYNGATAIEKTKVKCAICKPVDPTITDNGSTRVFFGFETPNDATIEG